MNRYTYQFNASFKPRMAQIEGFVSIGTGGQLNYPDAYPVLSFSGTYTGTSVQTGVPRAYMPGQATLASPSGWQGGFSGCYGLLGAGVGGIQRVGTGLYAVQLSDDYTRLDSVQVNYFANPSGVPTGALNPAGFSGSYQQDMGWYVKQHTVGLGNSVVTGGMTLPVFPGPNPKNTIWLQFTQGGSTAELNNSDGFFLDIRVRDTLNGVQ